MVLSKTPYKVIVAFLVLFHIPLFFMANQFIEFGDKQYPIPVILILMHTWLWMESRSREVDVKTSFHMYGILTGVLGFLPGLLLHALPNTFAVIVGLMLLGRFVTEGKERNQRKREYYENQGIEQEEDKPTKFNKILKLLGRDK